MVALHQVHRNGVREQRKKKETLPCFVLTSGEMTAEESKLCYSEGIIYSVLSRTFLACRGHKSLIAKPSLGIFHVVFRSRPSLRPECLNFDDPFLPIAYFVGFP